MAVAVTLQAMEEMNKYVLGMRTTPFVLKFKLFSNAYTPNIDSEELDFVEVDRAGYSPRTLVGVNWVFTFIAATYSLATYPDFTFLFSEATGVTTNIRGWYVVDEATDPPTVMWADAVSTVVIPPAGGSLKVSTFKTEKQC